MTPARLLRALALLAWSVLVVALAGWYRATPLLALALLLPLVLPLRGLWRGERYTYAWCSLLVLFYLGLGVVEAAASPAVRGYAYAVFSAAGLLFVSCLLYVRSAKPGLPAAPRAPSES